MKKLSWTNRARNEVLQGVKVERNIVHRIKRRNAKCIGQMLRWNCLLRHVIEGKIRGRAEDDVTTYWKTLRKRENIGN